MTAKYKLTQAKQALKRAKNDGSTSDDIDRLSKAVSDAQEDFKQTSSQKIINN